MQLEVTAVPVRQITESAPEEPSEAIHARVQAARKRQQARYAGEGVSSNAELSARQLEQFCPLDEACRELIGKACDKYNLSMRAVSRVRKVARTIADLAGRRTSARRIFWKRCGIAIWKELLEIKGVVGATVTSETIENAVKDAFSK